ncbi:hypothetical protein QJS10_CPA16g01007 [Acorus calamus]|uniref:RRP12-like protein n=1 Tax=Acorus calamus TaxID=4465 RepID=A0AAV9CZG6_ACOCL|nr:hypothetical protein QJS10_CPA16g01007 [Acorus calamus]
MEEELEEPTLPVAGDVCLALMGRYGRSSAAQHRHLCATAAAMRSLLEEEQLPLTPPSYFAAAIDSLIHNHSELDAVSISALSAFLSVLLPSLPARSLPPGRASDAAFALIGFLRVPPENLMCSASVRSMVGSLGFLISCIDSEDWVEIRRGFNLLLEFAVDKRPKVRRCAQVCIEKNLKYFEKSVIKEKASKAVLSSFNGCLHVACDMNALVIENGSASKGVTCPEHLEVLHMLSAVKALIPVLSRKVIQKILSSVCMFLGPRFSMITRHIHSLIEVIFKHSGNENISFEADKIVHNLSSYVTSIEKKPIDTVMSAMTLLKSALDMLHALDPSTWSKNLPLVFNHIAGFLNSEANISSHAANILKEIISCHIERSTFLVSGIQSLNDNINNSEANSLISICSALENMLGAWNIIPDEHTLAVISNLFLKLGECAHLFMKGIVLKLSKWAVDLNDDVPGKEHLQKCIGSAVIALGPEKMLLLLPITLHSENLTCSNPWLIPILKKYVIGASLQFFMEHVVPLAKSLKKACSEAQKSPKLLELQSSLQGLWGLLPAFCNYTTDTSKSIKSVVSCLIATFNDDPSTHEMISIALQVLVNQNRGVIMAKQKSEEDVVEISVGDSE